MLGKVFGHFHNLAHSRLGYNSVGDSHSGCIGISSGVSTARGFGIVLIFEIENTTMLFCSVDIVVTIVTHARLI